MAPGMSVAETVERGDRESETRKKERKKEKRIRQTATRQERDAGEGRKEGERENGAVK